MIHGMWGGAWCWQNYRRFFQSHGYQCVATTLPYHDREPRSAPDPRLGSTSLLDYAAALEREIVALAETPILMGHSMGGLLAQMLAGRGLARALVLLAPASPAGIFSLSPSVLRSFWSLQTTPGFWKKPFRPTFPEARFSMLHRLPEAEQRTIYEKLGYESGRAAAEIGYWFFDPKRAAKVDEARVTCPVLAIGGGQDRIVPISVTRKVARKYAPTAACKEFANHGHWIVGEPGWADVAGYACRWLGSLPDLNPRVARPVQ